MAKYVIFAKDTDRTASKWEKWDVIEFPNPRSNRSFASYINESIHELVSQDFDIKITKNGKILRKYSPEMGWRTTRSKSKLTAKQKSAIASGKRKPRRR